MLDFWRHVIAWVGIVWLLFGFAPMVFLPHLEQLSQFGDSFGFVNALFSGLRSRASFTRSSFSDANSRSSAKTSLLPGANFIAAPRLKNAPKPLSNSRPRRCS